MRKEQKEEKENRMSEPFEKVKGCQREMTGNMCDLSPRFNAANKLQYPVHLFGRELGSQLSLQSIANRFCSSSSDQNEKLRAETRKIQSSVGLARGSEIVEIGS